MTTDLNNLDQDSREFIFRLFRGRCVICHRQGTDINEIVPRSRGKDSLHWKNKVLMCREDHDKYHRLGVSLKAIEKLQEQRVKFLIAMGREDWV